MSTYYGVNATNFNSVATKGAQARSNPADNSEIQVISDRITIDVSEDYANADVLAFGPIPAGAEVVRASVTGVTSATNPLALATADLGDDVDVGWIYADASSSNDDAFAVARDLSAALVDTVLCVGKCAPPTNDRAWFLTLSPDDVTGEADGTFEVVMFTRQQGTV